MLAGESEYATTNIAGVLATVFLFFIGRYWMQSIQNPYGAYIIEILPKVHIVFCSVLLAVFLIRFLVNLQIATFDENGVSFRTPFLKLGTVSWESLHRVQVYPITVYISSYDGFSRRRRRRKTNRVYLLLENHEYYVIPHIKLNQQHGGHARVLPEYAVSVIKPYLATYRPDIIIENNTR